MSTIQSVMHENRVFEPSPAFVAQANVRKADYEAMYAEAERDFEGFWARPRARARSRGTSRSQGARRIATRRSSSGSRTAS